MGQGTILKTPDLRHAASPALVSSGEKPPPLVNPSTADDQFRAIFDSVHDGIFLTDPTTGRFIAGAPAPAGTASMHRPAAGRSERAMERRFMGRSIGRHPSPLQSLRLERPDLAAMHSPLRQPDAGPRWKINANPPPAPVRKMRSIRRARAVKAGFDWNAGHV